MAISQYLHAQKATISNPAGAPYNGPFATTIIGTESNEPWYCSLYQRPIRAQCCGHVTGYRPIRAQYCGHETGYRPIRAQYCGHVTGYRPIRAQYVVT